MARCGWQQKCVVKGGIVETTSRQRKFPVKALASLGRRENASLESMSERMPDRQSAGNFGPAVPADADPRHDLALSADEMPDFIYQVRVDDAHALLFLIHREYSFNPFFSHLHNPSSLLAFRPKKPALRWRPPLGERGTRSHWRFLRADFAIKPNYL
jgi:hypothetical protein